MAQQSRDDYLRLKQFLTRFRGTLLGFEVIFVKNESGYFVSFWPPVLCQKKTFRALQACWKATWGCFSYASSSDWSEVSDKVTNRPFPGNFESPWEQLERLYRHPGKRRLVEECEAVSVYAVQEAFGKKALIAAIHQTRPFRLPVPGGYFDVGLVDELHRLPGRQDCWSSLEAGTARLWFICSGCRRKVAKLYYYFAPGSYTRSDLLCRHCHGLTYQSSNCGGNRWYRDIARPMKRLLREKRKLLARQHSPRVAARLALIENLMRKLREKVKPRTQRRTQTLGYGMAVGERRPYRDLALLDQ